MKRKLINEQGEEKDNNSFFNPLYLSFLNFFFSVFLSLFNTCPQQRGQVKRIMLVCATIEINMAPLEDKKERIEKNKNENKKKK